MTVSEYLTAEAFTKESNESPKETVQRSERLFNELDALLDQVGEKLQELRLASCFAPQGQPIVARVRVPRIRNVSTTLTAPKLGSRVELRVRGVGPATEREDISTTIVVPTAKHGAAVKKVGENEGLVWREPWSVKDDAEFSLRKRTVRSQPPIPRRCALHHIPPSTAPAHHPTRS